MGWNDYITQHGDEPLTKEQRAYAWFREHLASMGLSHDITNCEVCKRLHAIFDKKS